MGEEVGWKTGRGPGGKVSCVMGGCMRVGGRNDTFFSPRWGRCEGAGLGDEAPQTGTAVAGQVDGEGGHCG